MNKIVWIWDNFEHPSWYSALKIRKIIREWISTTEISYEELYSIDISWIMFVDNKFKFFLWDNWYSCFAWSKKEFKMLNQHKNKAIKPAINLYIWNIKERCDVIDITKKRD